MILGITEHDLSALILTLKLASVTTLVLLLVGLPMAWSLSRMRHPGRVVLEAFIALPLVLPPTVLGFYLLIAFAPDAWLGQAWQAVFDRRLAFSFEALVIGSVLYSLPFVVQPMQQAFQKIPHQVLEVYSSMGMNLWQRLVYVVLPMSRAALLAALSLGFAHTLGEFGVVLMIGGNIPGETQVVSIALYEHVEMLDYTSAHRLSAMLIILSMCIMTLTYAKVGAPMRWRFES